jgi:hypothetical protein
MKWTNLKMSKLKTPSGMLAMEVPFVQDAQLTTIDVPNPNWISERA